MFELRLPHSVLLQSFIELATTTYVSPIDGSQILLIL